jgi:hypothetical protein
MYNDNKTGIFNTHHLGALYFTWFSTFLQAGINVSGYHYLKYVSLPRGHQSAVNIADILLQKNGTQTSRYTKMLRLVHILPTARATDINLRTICNMHHIPISISLHHGQFTSGWMLTDYLCHGLEVEQLLAPIRGYMMVERMTCYRVAIYRKRRGNYTRDERYPVLK